MPLRTGDSIGPYEIAGVLGRGGMGTVYLAHDRRLDRHVALKFLHADGPAGTHGRASRLLREARAASRLNHPNICQIHEIGIGESESESWIAMEYVQGDTLRSLAGTDGLPVSLALPLAVQIVDGLAHAHANGVLHRDLKSANVVRDMSGRVRILDFGIAARVPESVADDVTRTVTLPAGAALEGTLAYMAPEILRGQAATERSDLWSVGILLYELLTGRLPFDAANAFEMASAILESPAPALPEHVPMPLARIVRRLLSKDPSERYLSAVKVREALEAIGQRDGSARSTRSFVVASVVVLLGAVAGGAVYTAWLSSRLSPLQLSAQRLLSTGNEPERAPAFSPDGLKLAFLAPDGDGVQQVWVKELSQNSRLQVTTGPAGAGRPRWAPDGARIIYARADGIWSVPSLGGTPTRLVNIGSNPNLSRDGRRMVFESQRRLWIAGADGSNARGVSGVSPVYYSQPMAPALSPDGSMIAFFRAEAGPNGDLWVVPANGGEPRQLTRDLREGGWPVWTPDGRAIVFSSARAGSRTLWQIPAAGGEPVPLTTGAGDDDQPDIAADASRLVYTNIRNSWELRVRDLASGSERTLLHRGLELLFPMFSPDGRRLTFFGRSDFAVAIYTIATDGSDLRQLTGGRELNHQPRWGSDGEYVYFFQTRPTPSFRRVPSLGGPSTMFRDWRWETHNAPSFDPGGRLIAYVRQRAPGHATDPPDHTVIHEVATRRERAWAPPETHVTGWSDDGSELVGWRHDGSIVRCVVATASCRALAKGEQPVWPSRSDRIYFRRGTAAGEQLWSIAVDGGDEIHLADLGTFRTFDRFFDVSRQGLAAWAPFRPGRHELWVAELQ